MRMHILAKNLLVGVCGIGGLVGQCHALTYFDTVSIERLLTHDTNFGQCMALVSKIPPGVSCSSPGGQVGWVTFACDGTFGSKSANLARFSNVQLAFVTGGQVVVYADDSKKLNGHCYSPRVDVISPP